MCCKVDISDPLPPLRTYDILNTKLYLSNIYLQWYVGMSISWMLLIVDSNGMYLVNSSMLLVCL